MNFLLILFAIPFAVIVVSIALQKLLKCPYLVAAIIFSIFLVIGFAISDTNYILAGVVYAIISFITAYITMLIHKYRRNNNNNLNNGMCAINNNDNNGYQSPYLYKNSQL